MYWRWFRWIGGGLGGFSRARGESLPFSITLVLLSITITTITTITTS